MLRPDISRLRKNRGIYLRVGFLLAIAFVTFAFTIEVAPPVANFDFEVSEEPLDTVIEIPITKQEKPKVLPPPPIKEIIEPEPVIETPEFVEELIPKDLPVKKVENPKPVEIPERPAPPVFKMPEAKNENVTDIVLDKTYLIVEEMPRFPGCEDHDLDKNSKKKCAEKAMLEFIYSKVSYPSHALQNGIEGTVNISFVIGKDGRPRDFEVVRAPHPVLGKEAIRVLKLMPDWIPGKQRFRPVAVKYNLPVTFGIRK